MTKQNGIDVWPNAAIWMRDELRSKVRHFLKTVQIFVCENSVKFPPILIIFGRKMAKRLKLCKVHSFSTSINS